MLTKRQNLRETMSGGEPDRFVNQYEAFGIISGNPINDRRPVMGKGPIVNAWGITKEWPAGTPGPFPVHDQEHIVIQDIEHWRDYVHAPDLSRFTAADWEPIVALAEKIDRNEQYAMPILAPGIFEQCHYLCEIKNCLIYLMEYPGEMHDLIRYLTEWELTLAEQYCAYVKPDGLFHHDDWGTQISTFMSPDMFAEFFLDAYKELYGYYKSHGVEVLVHHSDSYAATLVPYMIEMGIDIWQGVITTNDIPTLISEYGGQITFMGGIDSGSVDREDWTPESIEREVRRACTEYGRLYYIPSASQGIAKSTFDGVYDCITDKIALVNAEMSR